MRHLTKRRPVEKKTSGKEDQWKGRPVEKKTRSVKVYRPHYFTVRMKCNLPENGKCYNFFFECYEKIHVLQVIEK